MAESLGSNRRLLVVGQSSVQSDSDPDCGIEFLQEIVQATSSRRHVGQPLITIEIYRVILRPEPFVLPGLFADTQSFVRSSLSTAYPEATSSARFTSSSLNDTQAHLTSPFNFASQFARRCKLYSELALPTYKNSTEKNLRQ
ncbi:hypothetical protein CVT25_007065 [Psilocybe cyanescens]|uniref:Uncharacterized protein n=1 Tax=Psilocybe cyanescens TaxID=93625 RepID=A0A409WY72_PSICY|nr:hypothetical protein CVT25_007065 [Psilocybe cyanescens]